MPPRPDPVDVTGVLDGLLQRLAQDRRTNIGFPGATDFDYTPLAPFLNVLLNNHGDPYIPGVGGAHTKDIEVEVIEFLADLFRAPADDRWGYLTSGGTEATLYALQLARNLYPTGRVYYSESTHDSVAKAVDILRMPKAIIRASGTGEIDYEDLHHVLSDQRDQPPIIVANIGTTMTEAVDNIPSIKRVLRSLALHQHFIHSDAALAGIPLALEDETAQFSLIPGGADSICVSGHKFIGSPFPYGVVLTRRSLRNRTARNGSYTGSPDATITGSRSGLAPLLLWYRLHQLGWAEGLARRTEESRRLAEYTTQRLNEIGWEAWRNPYAFTVVIKTPPADVLASWALATHDGWSHIICVPGITKDHIDRFVNALRASPEVEETVTPPPKPMIRPATPPSKVSDGGQQRLFFTS